MVGYLSVQFIKLKSKKLSFYLTENMLLLRYK